MNQSFRLKTTKRIFGIINDLYLLNATNEKNYANNANRFDGFIFGL